MITTSSSEQLRFPLPHLTPHESHYFGNLKGAARSLILSELVSQFKGTTLIITPDHLSAMVIQEELRFFWQGRQTSEEDLPQILLFPDWETLPYDHFSPHQDLISERLATLAALPTLKHVVLVTSMATLMRRIPPCTFIQSTSLSVAQGERLSVAAFRERLKESGYTFVNKVMEHGECAIRGSIIDLYPMGHPWPFRLDFFDEDIEKIKRFDPDTQCSTQELGEIKILPAREYPLTDKGITHFRQAWRNRFSGNPMHCPLYQEISEKHTPQGIEYYLPLFFEDTATLLDYLPKDPLIIEIGDVHEAAQKFWQETKVRYEQRSHDITRPILKPQEILRPIDEIFGTIKTFTTINCQEGEYTHTSAHNFKVSEPPEFPLIRNAAYPLEKFDAYLEQCQFPHVLICAESTGRREVLMELLHPKHTPTLFHHFQDFLIHPCPLGILAGPLTEGAEMHDLGLALIAESQFFGKEFVLQKRRQKGKLLDPEALIKDLTELHVGAPVVHIEYGIGRYLGLKNIALDGQTNEFLMLEYAGGDLIYVPVTGLHAISRYTGMDVDHAPLHRLGSDRWKKERKQATEKISDVAASLLHLYAEREAASGFACRAPDSEYQAFAATFPFEETPDQKHAIEDVLRDMQLSKPMDRLICGDVGFGKTEVAMRAAFLAVQNSKQVCILAPTTLLSQQHFDNFCDRFSDFPINIALLSRFKTEKESKQILEKLKRGAIDIVIGTHKLLQKTTVFQKLGLLVIDEEHRFGVKQKEFIKSLRHEVDILSLAATPIPRTLNMALAGIREISLIMTPPAKRLSIKTFWQERNDALLREAILREIMRGGQVFYVHNEISTLQKIESELQALVPEAAIQSAHGQMRERALEKIMSDFYHHRFNVLVCTTIIESGIDIPTANTIIIDNADHFGLAQLHQLRGRVGRSHHQAYAYLFTPPRENLTRDAEKRLNAITSQEDLGAGFLIATHDLEIRGAGELLGEEQSGEMQILGFHLYMELLEKTVQALKSGQIPTWDALLQQETEVDLKVSAIIPEDFVPDIHMRLVLYKRIANAKTQRDLDALHVEIIDRFGLLPEPLKNLFKTTEIKLSAESLGIKKISANAESGKIEFRENPPIAPETILNLIQVHSKVYKFDGPERLKFCLPGATALARIANVYRVLRDLGAPIL